MLQGMVLLSYCRHHKKIDMLGKKRGNILLSCATAKKNW
jgi:hypothetical protein